MTPDAVAYQNYLRVRDAVLRMKQAGVTGTAAPSEYWNEELSNIDYMIEASPLIIRKLRHHAFQITGIRPYDYRVQDDVRSDAFKGRLQSLIELGGRPCQKEGHSYTRRHQWRCRPKQLARWTEEPKRQRTRSGRTCAVCTCRSANY